MDRGGGIARKARTAFRALVLASVFACPPAVIADEAGDIEPASEALALGETPLFSIGSVEYSPGRGLRETRSGLVLGGFVNVKAEEADEGGAEFSLDTLNVFLIFDRFDRLRSVAEIQLKDIFSADDAEVGFQDFAFDWRRLFGDFTVSDELRVSVGTFLTPVGYWNSILATPLTWSTERPLISEEIFFQETTTGVMLHGASDLADGQVAYSMFTQFMDPIEDDPELDPPDHTGGLRLQYRSGAAWAAGVSYQAAGESSDWTHLGGVDFFWQRGRGEILAEAMYQQGEGLDSAHWGGYLQGVVEMVEPLYLVGRYERFDPESPMRAFNVFSVGATYKPYPFMALKAEYRFADPVPEEDNPQGLFTSFTTLF